MLMIPASAPIAFSWSEYTITNMLEAIAPTGGAMSMNGK